MDQLQGMKVFVQVAQQVGFAAAARSLRMSPAAVSKHVTALEARIGTRLFDRTTRHVGLTEAGRVYLERCLECLQSLEDADASVSELSKAPKGILRVTAPIDFGLHLAPVIAEVMSAYPDIVVDLQFSNRIVDMVEEGIDVGVRIARALDGRYVARPLARSRLAVFGAPEYLRKHGRPRRPEDLASHRHIVFAEPKPLDTMVFFQGRREVRVSFKAVITSNNGEALMTALREGLGLHICPSFMAHRDLEARRIEPLLLDWSLPEFGVFAVYPHRRFLSPKVRVFVEALRTKFGDGTSDPWWPQARIERSTAQAAPRRAGNRAAPRRAARRR